MKKTLIIAGILALSASAAITNAKCDCALPPQEKPPMEHKMGCPPPPPPFEMSEEKKAEFHKKMEEKKAEMDKRLNLTEAQKTAADAIHQKTREAMTPIMEKIKSKHEEIKAVTLSKISSEEQAKKIEKIKTEIDALRQQAREIHKSGKAEFEAILTEKQKQEFAKMKKEHKKELKKKCKCFAHGKSKPCKCIDK